jgi:uncharacterized protein YkwD
VLHNRLRARRGFYGLATTALLLTMTGCSDAAPAPVSLSSTAGGSGTTSIPASTSAEPEADPSPSLSEARPSRSAKRPSPRTTSAAATEKRKRPDPPRASEKKPADTRRATRTTKPAARPASQSPRLTRLERRAMKLINGHRRDHGCGPLTVDARLLAASREYATKMVETKRASHESVDGDGPSERAQRAGFPGGAAENIMMGAPDDPDGLVNNPGWGWMQSEGHRNNILDCNANVAGIGYDPGLIDPNFASGSWVLMISRLG